jgi:segregation and condensation protein B
MINLEQKIEAVLFWKSEPISVKKLASILSETEENVGKAILELEKQLEGRGIRVIKKDNEVTLGTHAEISELIENITKEELSKDIGKAGMETLSTILYYGPISRRDIDYIRGVNSTFIIRNLLVRGLIEKAENDKDQRIFMYKPTFDLLAFLGITKIEDLPDYTKIREEFEAFKQNRERVEGGEEVGEKNNESVNIEGQTTEKQTEQNG